MARNYQTRRNYYSPSLADKLARNTATYTINQISEEITQVINEKYFFEELTSVANSFLKPKTKN